MSMVSFMMRKWFGEAGGAVYKAQHETKATSWAEDAALVNRTLFALLPCAGHGWARVGCSGGTCYSGSVWTADLRSILFSFFSLQPLDLLSSCGAAGWVNCGRSLSAGTQPYRAAQPHHILAYSCAAPQFRPKN